MYGFDQGLIKESGIRKDKLQMRVVYKRIGFRREWYTNGSVLDESAIQKDRFQTRVVYKRIGFK